VKLSFAVDLEIKMAIQPSGFGSIGYSANAYRNRLEAPGKEPKRSGTQTDNLPPPRFDGELPSDEEFEQLLAKRSSAKVK
jgi:hypothetical protein